ncbi:MAG TPA: hypothetical protein VFB32_07780 [Rudaea sp.]|nr:hypothetical protein [Rudaea sp.]
MSTIVSRVFAAVPDAITAAVFCAAWKAPAVLGNTYVDDLVLVMFLQAFIIFLGLVFMILIAGDGRGSRLGRLGALAMMTVVSLFILTNVLHQMEADHSKPTTIGFDVARPELLYAFGWLTASNFAHLLTHPAGSADVENRRISALALYTFVSYIAAFLAAILLPLPPLGLTPQVVADMHRVDDVWGAKLYIPIAFGAIYFGALACVKAALVGRTPAAVI